MPELEEKYGLWAPLVFTAVLVVIVLPLIGFHTFLNGKIDSLERQEDQARARATRRAEDIATVRDGRASTQRQAMVDELRTLNAAMAPCSQALRRSARPHY